MSWDWHKKVSYCKSTLRISGFIFLGFESLVVAALLLSFAEVLGIIEEF